MEKRSDQQTVVDRLVEALNRDRFILYRQLIVPIAPPAEDIIFQEILVRHVEEEEKLLPPGAFFPVLESNGLMYMLDRWVVNRVIRWFLAKYKAERRWVNARCSINLSGDSVANADFSRFVREQLLAGRMPQGKLAFEISEVDAEKHALALDRLIAELNPVGCAFTLTGYTGEFVGEELLQAFGIACVKIDGRIIGRIHEDAASAERVKSIHQTCRSLRIRTIGEFVEQAATLDRLREIGVDYAQGYGVAAPEPLV